MKTIVFTICLLFIQENLTAQAWKDSLNVARKLYKQGKYQDALDSYKSTKKIAPKDINLNDEMGQTAYKAEQFDKAEKIYEQSNTKKGNTTQKAKTYHNLGNAKLKQKKYEEAISAYKEALRNNPNDEETRYNLAEAMKKKKSQDKNQEQKNQDKQNPKDPQNNQQQNKDPQEQKQDAQNQPNKPENGKEELENQQSKLSDKKTERMLDELSKKEMETKKKLGGNKNKNSTNKSGKDW